MDNSKLKGLEKAVKETKSFDRVVKETYNLTAMEVYGSLSTPDVAAFAYGSPGRIEMVGGDSDADVFLIERKITEKSRKFKRLLKEALKHFDFSKIDMPDWGSFDEIKVYLAKSLVEGNQVLETRFLLGDEAIVSELKEIKKRYNTPERALKNIIFNRFYFNQYFKQKD